MSAVPRITLVEPEPEQERALQSQALDVAKEAKGLVVKDAESFRTAGEWLKNIKGLASVITTFFEPLKRKAHEAHRALTAAEKDQLAPLVEAEAHLKRGMAVYQEEEERRRREEERRLQEESRKRAEEERLQLAIDAERSGDKESAEELLAAPVEAPIVVVKPAASVAGVSFRDNWRGRVKDIRALARGVADGTVPTMAILPNQSFIDAQAKAGKGEIKYAGVEFYSEKIVSASRA